MKAEKVYDMTKGNPIKEILLFALPMFVGNVFQQIYSIVDTMVAGYFLGDEAIAAIGVTASLYSFIISFAVGINSGSTLVLTRSIGAGDKKGIRKNIAVLAELNAFIVVTLTVIVCTALGPILHLINTPVEIFERAYAYMITLCIGIVATVLYNMCAGILRAFGNSKTALYFLIVSSLLNVVLDFIWVAGFRLDVMGAALATVISEFVSGLLCLLYILKNYSEYIPQKEDINIDTALLKEQFSSGMAMALMYCANDFGSIIFSGANNMLGTMYITAHTTARRIILIMMQPLATIASAYATFAGQNYGAGEYKRIKETTRKVLFMEVAWGVFSFVFIFFAGEHIVRLITGTSDRELIQNAVFSIRFQHAFYPALGILLCMRICLQAMGEKKSPVFASTMELTMKILFAVLVIPRIGFIGTVITEPIIWVICGIYILLVYVRKRNGLFGMEVENDRTGKTGGRAGVQLLG